MNQRLESIVESATMLFLTQGYSKTQISHIAKSVGVSVGTIYHSFVGKEEIMHYILKSVIDPSFVAKEISMPINDKYFLNLDQEIVDLFAKSADDFEKHLISGIQNYSFEDLISDVFDLFSKYAVGFLFIEKNQYDFPVLRENYKVYRKRFFETMKDYLTAFVANGSIREIENVELTTILIVEILSWWAMDRRYTSFELNSISTYEAKKICVEHILFAYQKKH